MTNAPHGNEPAAAERSAGVPPSGEAPSGLGRQGEAGVGAERQRPAQGAAEPEKALWEGRMDWRHFGGACALYVGAAAAVLIICAIWFSSATLCYTFLLVIIGAVLAGARGVWIILSTRYRLTTERLFIERGIVRQTIDQIELVRVDDIRVTKGVVDRVFGLGSVQILSTDFTDRSVEIKGVADADGVAELVRSRMRAARDKSLFVEHL